jgi:hypothetical protein
MAFHDRTKRMLVASDCGLSHGEIWASYAIVNNRNGVPNVELSFWESKDGMSEADKIPDVDGMIDLNGLVYEIVRTGPGIYEPHMWKAVVQAQLTSRYSPMPEKEFQ